LNGKEFYAALPKERKMKKFRVTIHLEEVEAEDDDSQTVKEAVKSALNRKMLQDDSGDEEFEFEAEEIEDYF